MKKEKKEKTKDERAYECAKIRREWEVHGISEELETIQKVIRIMEDFEEKGIGASGAIRFPEIGPNVMLEYKFSLRPHIPSGIQMVLPEKNR